MITALLTTGILTLHLIIEGCRWQLFFIYLFSILFIVRLLLHKKVRVKIWKPALYLLRTIILFFMMVSTCLAVYMPVTQLPKPEGEYKIGMQTLHLIDNNRDETFTKDEDDVRQLMVQVWYPAHNTKDNTPAFLFPQEKETFKKYKEAYANELHVPVFLFDHLKYIKTNSYEDAHVLPSKEPFPVVLLSHGTGTSKNFHVSQAENLASHGYIVVTIDHTYMTIGTDFPDGTFTTFQADDFATNFFKPNNKYGDIFQKDIDFVINYLQQLHTGEIPSSFEGKMDLENIGVMGHSFGGATAFHAVHENSNIKAGINMDGTLYDLENTDRLSKPFLFIQSEAFISSRKKIEQGIHSLDGLTEEELQQLEAYKKKEYQIIDNTIDSGGTMIAIEGAEHYNFTDLQLFSDFFSLIGMTGEIDGERSSFIVNQCVLDFFDEHLKGKQNEQKKDFPEVMVYEKTE